MRRKPGGKEARGGKKMGREWEEGRSG